MIDDRARAIRDYFLDTSGRAEPTAPNPLFAGRDTEIDSILHYASKLDRSDTPLANMTALLYGAPGAGKSEILVQLREALTISASENPVVLLAGGAELLTEAAAVSTAIYEAAPAPLRNALRHGGWSIDRLSMNVGPVGVVASPKEAPAPVSEVTKLRKIARDLKDAGGGLAPTVIFLIDEAQAELAEAQERPDRFVRALHKGETGLKTLTIYGGLGNTEVELGKCGVTRPGDHMMFLLERLEDKHVVDTARRALSVTTAQLPKAVDEWATEIVDYAQGWPMHLSHALRAVAERAHSRGWTMDAAGFASAMRNATHRRDAYYNARLRAGGGTLDPDQYAPWAEMFKDHDRVHEGTVGDALGLSRAKAREVTARAVRAGLIEPYGPWYVSPIPSLIDHIEGLGREMNRKR